MQSIRNINVLNKRILIRVDFNVQFDKKNKILDDFRLKKTIQTLKYLLKQKPSKIILISHLGNPNLYQKNQKKFSLKLIIPILEKLLSQKIYFIKTSIKGEKINQEVEKLKKGTVCLLENIRFYPEEDKNDITFAKKLASLGDIYINEAFSFIHRKTASNSSINNFLPSFIGLNFEQEIHNLKRFLSKSKKPITVILGGAKIEDKLPFIQEFFKFADYFLVGGGIANTLLKSLDLEIGKSLFKESMIKEAKKIMLNKAKIILPNDFIILKKNKKVVKQDLEKIEKNDIILDIGPKSIKNFSQVIKESKTIIWNGPLGKIEDKQFSQGTRKIADIIYKTSDIFTIIGGGETIASIKSLKNKNNKLIFLSTGGGAMLKFLLDKKLQKKFKNC